MAEIRVNAQQWNAVKEEDQKRIDTALKAVGALKPDDVIVPDLNAPVIKTQAVPGTSGWLCEFLCHAAANAGRAACFQLVDPVAIAACLAAVEVALKKCLKEC